MDTVDVLRRAKEILSDPERWTRKALVRTSRGGAMDRIQSADALSFCAMGALYRVCGLEDTDLGRPPEFGAAFDALSGVVGGRDVASFNNDPYTTHADLIDAFDRAILSLAGEGIASETQPSANVSQVIADAPSPVEVGSHA